MMYNADLLDLEKASAGLLSSFYSLEHLIVALSYVIGLTLTIRGLMMYRIFANQTYGSAQRGEIAGPLVFLVVGIVLLYFPTSINLSVNTLFGSSELSAFESLAGYQSTTTGPNWYLIQNVIVKYLNLIGLIAFIRGWVILSKMGHSGAQPGSIAKGIVHIVGGIILINLISTIKVLAGTFGLQL